MTGGHADEKPPQHRAGAVFVRTQERATDERNAVQLVRPKHRAAEASGRHQHQTRDSCGSPKRDLKRDPTAQRVSEKHRALDAELPDDVQYEIRKLREARIRFLQRRREAEPRQLDDVRRVAKRAERACLRRQRDRRRTHAR